MGKGSRPRIWLRGTEEQRASGKALLRAAKITLSGDVAEAVKSLTRGPGVQRLVRHNREAYLAAISTIMAAFLRLSVKDEEARAKIIARLAKVAKSKSTLGHDPLRLLCRAIIDYGDDPSARQLWSRDAMAVRHLITAGILPKDVVSHGRKAGEGLDQWGRAYSQSLSSGGEAPDTKGMKLPSRRTAQIPPERQAALEGPYRLILVKDIDDKPGKVNFVMQWKVSEVRARRLRMKRIQIRYKTVDKTPTERRGSRRG